jgi:adenine-specific DNA-methyltransferase
MKYMGSKRAMLAGELGGVLLNNLRGRRRFVDLFSGSGAVARFVATRLPIPVRTVDLQAYAAILAGATLHRTHSTDAAALWRKWESKAEKRLTEIVEIKDFADAVDIEKYDSKNLNAATTLTDLVRDCVDDLPSTYVLSKAYAGHYFSLLQALWIDALRLSAEELPNKELAIAALIEAASACSASPGHTAQPFALTKTGAPHIFKAWSHNVATKVQKSLHAHAVHFALCSGKAVVGEALAESCLLEPTDLVFIDPPYSEVQYSRFYHVLEAVATGFVGSVTGIGRYPDLQLRPQSEFSKKLPALEAFNMLMIGVATSGANAVITFPEGDASNGLSGDLVQEICSQYFFVKKRVVESTFSTLGGTVSKRGGRQGINELILVVSPR